MTRAFITARLLSLGGEIYNLQQKALDLNTLPYKQLKGINKVHDLLEQANIELQKVRLQ